MLRFFRINDPYRLLGLLVLFLLLSIPNFLAPSTLTKPEVHSFIVGEKITEGFTPYTELMDAAPLLTQWMYGLVDFVGGRHLALRHILAFIALFLQACYLGIVFINKKAFTENTYVPSAVFIVLCLFSFDVVAVTGTLLASGFLLLAINSLFNEIEFREPKDETLLKLGFYLSLASLSSFSYIVFFFAALLILILFTRASLRRHLLFLTGFLLPHALLMSWYYFIDGLPHLWNFFYAPSLEVSTVHLVSLQTLFLLGSVPLFYFFVSFFVLNRAVRLTNYQSQLLQAMFIWLLAGVVHLFFAPVLRPQSLLPLFPPLAFLLAHFLLAIRRRRFAEFHFWVLMLGTVATSTAVRYGWVKPSSYESLVVSTPQTPVAVKRILVLSSDRSAYAQHSLATGFAEWALVEKIWKEPRYYENTVLINNQLSRDLPDEIIDPQNLLAPFLEQLPSLQREYKKTGTVYLRNRK